MTIFKDLGDLTEDDRVQQIAEKLATGATVAFVVEDIPGKADRYLTKLRGHLPFVVEARLSVSGTVWLKLRRADA